MAQSLRKTFPKIRVVTRNGSKLYEIDARRRNGGRRHHRVSRTEAEQLAQEIASSYEQVGREGIDFPTELRVTASRCARRLTEYGKTLDDATDYYIAYLKASKIIEDSRFIKELVEEWIKAKKENKRKILSRYTIDELEKMGRKLNEAFGSTKIRSIHKDDIEDYLDRQPIENQTRTNILVKWGQFFNWAIPKHTNYNPCSGVEVFPTSREIERYDAITIRAMLQLCESKYPDLLAYIAICTFAGLRPSECERLTWDKVSLETTPPQIEVIKTTLVVKDYTRHVTIEENLFEWLKVCKPNVGSIIRPNFRNRIDDFKIDAGFQLKGKNPDGTKWIVDGLRHTYASFWKAKYHNVNELAGEMGNSAEMIRKHYNKAVRSNEVRTFWSIVPKALQDVVDQESSEGEIWGPITNEQVEPKPYTWVDDE